MIDDKNKDEEIGFEIEDNDIVSDNNEDTSTNNVSEQKVNSEDTSDNKASEQKDNSDVSYNNLAQESDGEDNKKYDSSLNTKVTITNSAGEVIELDEDEDFEIIEENDELRENINKYRRKKRLKLTLIAIIVLVLCSAGCYLFIEQRAQLDRFDASLHSGQYTEAKKLYHTLMDSQRTEADRMVEAKTDDIYKKYFKGAFSINKSIEELDKLLTIESGAKDVINNKKELFAVLTKSEANYNKGKQAYDNGELKNSIIYYGKVVKKDAKYKSAQSLLKKISAEYRKQEIARAEEYVVDEDYDTAIKIMYDYLKLLSSDKVAMKKLQEYKSAKLDLNIADIEDSVDVAVKKKDYVEAIEIVKTAMDDYGDDKRLVDMLPPLVSDMYEQVEIYVKSDRYSTAVSMLKSYLNIVGTDDKASGLVKEYSSKVSKGSYLSKMEYETMEGKSYVIEELSDYKDANGNTYEDVLEVVGYRNLETKGKLVYANDGYTTLTGSIGYVSSDDIEYYKDGSGKLFISGDGTVIFTSDEMTESSKNQEVNVDISKYKKITIEWKPTNANNVKMYSIVLGDFMFVK